MAELNKIFIDKDGRIRIGREDIVTPISYRFTTVTDESGKQFTKADISFYADLSIDVVKEYKPIKISYDSPYSIY